MIDIRPIRGEEAETFLGLLCTVFELDFERARTIFFSEPFFDLNRKWALFENGRMVSILTTTPLSFGWGRAIGISGVATLEDARGRGHAGRLLSAVLDRAETAGEGVALLFATDLRLYERLGFEPIDEVVRGTLPPDPAAVPELSEPPLAFDETRRAYDDWSRASPDRLRRDARRWRYWQWGLRVCEPLPHGADGYVCYEGDTVREIVAEGPCPPIRFPRPLTWIGLRSVSESLALPLTEVRSDQVLMARGLAGAATMFLTDQF